ncbi:MAG: hypothetical protein MI923_10525 [Phycisphaerales bacterium]|nr:hypothetical protein [Phycisphaerales bacterium]
MELPELVNMSDDTLRQRCLDVATNRVRSEIRPLHKAIIGLSYGGIGLLVMLVGSLSRWQGLTFAFVLAMAYSTVFWWIKRRRLRQHVRWAISELSGHCVNCGYDLTGSKSDVCSECGYNQSIDQYSPLNAWAAGRKFSKDEDALLFRSMIVLLIGLCICPIVGFLLLGNVLNSLLVGIASAIAIAMTTACVGWPKAKRRRWVREGRCPNCGYRLGTADHTTCPECLSPAEPQQADRTSKSVEHKPN